MTTQDYGSALYIPSQFTGRLALDAYPLWKLFRDNLPSTGLYWHISDELR
jgi:hypothetical protein